MRNLLFQWVPPHCRPRRWMALAFYTAERNRYLYVAFPFNLLIAAAWWVQDRWAEKANAPSWIEREVRDRLDHYIRSTQGIRKPRRLDP